MKLVHQSPECIRQMRSWEYRLASYRVAGVDEAGRGPLAGPVVAAACHIPLSVYIDGVDDSKRLSSLARARVDKLLREHPEVEFGIGVATSDEIDQLNIRQATLLAMTRAAQALPRPVDHLLIDGRDVPPMALPMTPIVSGDRLSYLIAAASILAKEERDRFMVQLDGQFPQYGFARHKGYPTADHLAALSAHGVTPHHRRSFAPVRSQLIHCKD